MNPKVIEEMAKPLYSTEMSRIHNKSLAPSGKIYLKIMFRWRGAAHRYVRLVSVDFILKTQDEKKEYFNQFYKTALEKVKAKFESNKNESL